MKIKVEVWTKKPHARGDGLLTSGEMIFDDEMTRAYGALLAGQGADTANIWLRSRAESFVEKELLRLTWTLSHDDAKAG